MGYFSANHQSSTYFDEKKILSYLPLGVARDLSVQLYKTILGESPLFANLGPELMLRVCQTVMPVRISAGQTVYEQGKVGSEMYFVLSGELEVICDGDRLGFLGQGVAPRTNAARAAAAACFTLVWPCTCRRSSAVQSAAQHAPACTARRKLRG